MKSNEISTISPLLFKGKLVIVIDCRWLELFQEESKFTALINDDNRLILVGPKIADLDLEKERNKK